MTRDDFIGDLADRIHTKINSQVRSPTKPELMGIIKVAVDVWEIHQAAAKAPNPYDMGLCVGGTPTPGADKLPLGSWEKPTYQQVIDDTLEKWCEEIPEEEVQGPPQGGWVLGNLFSFFGGYVTERMQLMGWRLVSKRDGLHTDACTWRFFSINQDQAVEIELTALEVMKNKTIDRMMQLGGSKIARALAPVYLR